MDRHLGRNAAGEASPVYVTPTEVDPELLVPVPRSLNREPKNISALDFVGYDRWNCYEFSTLLKGGFPLSGGLQIIYASNSDNIVESKSLKLYLNSFNMHQSDSWMLEDTRRKTEKRITDDLAKMTGIRARVNLTLDARRDPRRTKNFFKRDFPYVERGLLNSARELVFQQSENPEKYLQTNGYKRTQYMSSGIRSNCRVTNQPDWGRIYVYIKPGKTSGLSSESFFKYITAMRNQNHFHEEICENVYKDLQMFLNPEELLVGCNYMRRGGIDINPVRASAQDVLDGLTNNPLEFAINPDPRQ